MRLPRILRRREWVGQITCPPEQMPDTMEKWITGMEKEGWCDFQFRVCDPIWWPEDGTDVISVEFKARRA